MMPLLLCLFGTAYGHGPDANIFDELMPFANPPMLRVQPQVYPGKNTGNKKRITQSTSR